MKNKLKTAGKILIVIAFFSIMAFFIYTSFYYETDFDGYTPGGNVIELDNDTYLIKSKDLTDKALIFYPGAKVEFTAYIPLLEQLSQEANIDIYLEKMLYNLPPFSANKAMDTIESVKGINQWYIGGHSLGGIQASKFAEANENLISGLILLGSYNYYDFSASKTLTIYGSLEEDIKSKIDYDHNVFEIEGGNHAQFGNYGDQRGDAQAQISRQDQQAQTVNIITKFLQSYR